MVKPVDVIVLGTGRSGTSFVAAVLSHCLGVSMATKQKREKIIPIDEFVKINPYEKYRWIGALTSPNEVRKPAESLKHKWGGSWENGQISRAARHLVQFEQHPNKWLELFWEIQKEYSFTYYGCKSPWLTYAPEKFWNYVQPRIIINCVRSQEQVTKSKTRWGTEWNEEKHVEYLKQRGLLRELSGYIELNFTTERRPEYVIDRIKPIL